jgi:antitoxin YefM
VTTIHVDQNNHDVEAVLDQVRNSESTLLVNEAGDEFVLMPKKEWDSWQETLYLMSNPANAARVLKGIEQIKAGQVLSKNLDEL